MRFNLVGTLASALARVGTLALITSLVWRPKNKELSVM